jgi:hypothetical protein
LTLWYFDGSVRIELCRKYYREAGRDARALDALAGVFFISSQFFLHGI